jgi:hypothetical protein
MDNSELHNFVKKLEQLEEVAQQELEFIVENSENEIITKNQEQIFIETSDVYGNKLGTYSEYTERVNENQTFTFNGVSKKKNAGDNYFLLDTKDFFNSFALITEPEQFTIVAQTQKGKDNLINKFGAILGLNIENQMFFGKKWTENLTEILFNYLAN